MIAVLPPDCPPEVLTGARREAESRGWSCEVSEGADQTILAVSGPERLEELRAMLPAEVEVDVRAIRSRKHYKRLRRRRRIMHGIAWGLTVVIAFGLGFPVFSFLSSSVEGLLAPTLVRAGTTDEIPAGSSKLVRTDRQGFLVIRLDARRFFAVSAVCTHLNDCQLEWSAERLQIVCPCHGGVYDVYGNVVEGPPSIPLASFPIERSGEEILVRTGG